jgi:hypothetical protein
MPPVPQAGSQMVTMTPAWVSTLVSGFQQQVDHELDDFARGEVVAGRFVGGFVEAPDQVLEHQAHE